MFSQLISGRIINWQQWLFWGNKCYVTKFSSYFHLYFFGNHMEILSIEINI